MKRTLPQAGCFLGMVTVFLLTCGVEPLKVSKETGAPHAFIRGGLSVDSAASQDTGLFSKCDTVRVGDTVPFFGTVNPPDSRVKRVRWDFADGAHDTQPAAAHAYVRGGIYHAVFSIFDNVENSRSDSVVVCVNTPPDSISIISPAPGSIVQSLVPTLSWKGYDRDEFDTSLVYLVVADRGNGLTDTLVRWSEAMSVVLDKNINRGDHVSWFVLAKDKFGAVAKSRIASFSIQPSSDASLRGLDVSVGRLMPAFNATDSLYCDTVANTVTTIDLSFTFNEAAATMSISGKTIRSGVSSVSLYTSQLSNVFTLKTVAPDNITSKTYVLTVVRQASANAFLSDIQPSIGKVDPAFSDTIFGYSDTVPLATASIAFTPTAQDTSSTIAINGTACKSGDSSSAITLSSNKADKISFVIIAQDGKTQRTYTVTVIRRTSSDASLSSLEISAGTLKSCAAPIADTLRDTVSFMDSAVSITPSVLDTQASITINSIAVKSGTASSVALTVGTTEVKIKVIAPNGTTTKTYLLYIIRKSDSSVPLTEPPSGISAQGISPSAIRISWNDNPAATFYEIQRGAQLGGVFAARGQSTSNSFKDTGLQSGSTWYYRVSASNSRGATAFSTAVSATTFLKPTFSSQPQSQTVTETHKAVFSVVATGIPAPAYQWQKNKMNLPQSILAACTTTVLTTGDNNARFRCIVNNAAGVDTSDEAVLKVDSLFTKPFIGHQPGDTSIVTGNDIVLWISDTGSYVKVQWRKDGADLPLSVSCTLSIKAAKATDAGMYSVKVWNRLDSAISKQFQLRVLPKTLTGLSAQARSAASIGVSWNLVDGASWYKVLRAMGTNAYARICSTSQTSMVDTPLTEGASCTYKLSVGNASGETKATDSVTASTWFGPQISVPPQPQRIIIGQAINLSVTAAGLPACSFQWKKDGAAIAGATQSVFALTNSTLGDSGDYNVMATNAVRSVNSSSAHVTVVPLYSLSTASVPTAGGTIVRSKTAASYQRGDTVRLSAQAAAGYRFFGWSGDTAASDSAILVIMTKNKSINANFIKQFKLTLSSIANGVVNPSGTVTVDSGAATSIKATPNTKYKFTVWRILSGNASIDDSTNASAFIRLSQGDAGVEGRFLTTDTGWSAGCGKTLSTMKLDTGTYVITSAGLSREYIVSIPKDYDPNKPYRLIFAMHSMNSNMQVIVNDKFYQIKRFSDSTNTPCVFVAPNGISGSWNQGEKDHTFFNDMLKIIQNEVCIDTTRVFAVGFSMGAIFTYSLAQNHQQQLRAVCCYAAYSNSLLSNTGEPLAYMGTVGMSDGTCPPAAGRACRNQFIKNNGGDTSEITVETTVGSKIHAIYDYTGVNPKYPVKWCTFDGGHICAPVDSESGYNSAKSWVPGETWKFFTQF